MKALLVLALLASTASADALPDVIAHKLALPADLGVVRVYAPADDVSPAKVIVEPLRDPRAGRSSVRVTVNNKAQWVQVSIGMMADVHVATHALTSGQTLQADDFTVERRAIDGAAQDVRLAGATVKHDIAAGDAITAKDVVVEAPVARGTHVNIAIHKSGLTIRGTAVLETAAHVGEAATARVSSTHTLVHGTLVAADQLEVTP